MFSLGRVVLYIVFMVFPYRKPWSKSWPKIWSKIWGWEHLVARGAGLGRVVAGGLVPVTFWWWF